MKMKVVNASPEIKEPESKLRMVICPHCGASERTYVALNPGELKTCFYCQKIFVVK